MKTDVHFLSYLAHFTYEWEMFQTKVVQKIKTHILCSVTFFLKSCRLWDNVGKNIVQRGRPQMAIWRMRIACWITKATNTHSEYVILFFCFSHHNNGCTNAPQRYVIRTLPILFILHRISSYYLYFFPLLFFPSRSVILFVIFF